MTVLAVLAVLESTLPSFCLSYKIQRNEAAVAVLTVLAVSAVISVSVMTATPLKLNPPFSMILILNKEGKSPRQQAFECLPNPQNPWERRQKRSNMQGVP